MRINKFIAHATGLSRREADNAIAAGRVKINGVIAQMGAQTGPKDTVFFDGKRVGEKTNYTYIMLNKPVGYLCSRRSQGVVPTIFELLPKEYRALKPVGRLDKDSSGLILLTDDGDFAFRMTHPSFHKTKIYEVVLDKPLEPLHQQMISDYGVTLEDGVSKFLVEKPTDAQHERLTRALGVGADNTNLLRIEAEGPSPSYRVTMHEGRNRQIRRTFAALGYTVTKLHRTNFGTYSLNDLKPGSFEKVHAA